MIEADKLLMLISSTLLLSYVSGLFYKKTKIPDIIWALGFGIILGPLLGYFKKDLFISISPLMSTVALNVILFDAGINVNISLLLKGVLKSTVLSLTMLLTVMTVVGITLSVALPSQFTLLQGMLLGAMIGGTSTIAVFGILGGLEQVIPHIESTRVILMFESVISDPLCIIASITLIKMIMMPDFSIVSTVASIAEIFVVATFFGVSVGLLWSRALHAINGKSFTYILTLAILFPTYIIAEKTVGEGAGAIAALLFGLTIANHSWVLNQLHLSRHLEIDKERLRTFHEEISFFMKSFFFVYIGLIISLSVNYLAIGLGIFALIQFLRYGMVSAVGRVMHFSIQEKVLTRIIFPMGLPAFVMSQLPAIYDPNRYFFLDPTLYPNLCMPIVLSTVLFAAFACPYVASKQLS